MTNEEKPLRWRISLALRRAGRRPWKWGHGNAGYEITRRPGYLEVRYRGRATNGGDPRAQEALLMAVILMQAGFLVALPYHGLSTFVTEDPAVQRSLLKPVYIQCWIGPDGRKRLVTPTLSGPMTSRALPLGDELLGGGPA